MNTLPDELLLEIIDCATDVAGELDSNLDDRFRVPSLVDMEEMLKATMPTRRALVQVSRRLWNLATPVLYRSIIITHPHKINLLFKSIMEYGERSLLFQRVVRRFHLSICGVRRHHWRKAAAGTEELMKHLPNLKISCARGYRHPTNPLLFTALDPATSFPHLEAIQHLSSTSVLTTIESISHLMRSSPNLRVFLVPCKDDSEPKPNLYTFKYLKACYADALIDFRPNLEDTNKQPLSSQTPFPPLRSLYFWRKILQNINHNITRHITLLDITNYQRMEQRKVLDLSEFPQLRSLVISPEEDEWYFKVSDKNDKLREVGVRSELLLHKWTLVRNFRALVRLVLGFPIGIQRMRVLGIGMCRQIVSLGLRQSTDLLTWRKELEERGISLEGPDGLPLVEYLGSLSR